MCTLVEARHHKGAPPHCLCVSWVYAVTAQVNINLACHVVCNDGGWMP